jgi:hypothetical protein
LCLLILSFRINDDPSLQDKLIEQANQNEIANTSTTTPAPLNNTTTPAAPTTPVAQPAAPVAPTDTQQPVTAQQPVGEVQP